ncbi:MAG: hypothetical protein COW08_02620 [Ignavibacteriales bacterium CG12_big_fil_rev_8_21_14_0_65_30_8]|nr:MAG: hypothetical protein COW08_02620 [Ignavibacteriales bacterium CG12_big_fil_rev_8_21_14_0_65_30_8]
MKIFSLFTFLILFTICNYSQNNKSSLPKGVDIFQLDNGIQVLLIQKNNIPMVGINTVIKVGSAYETFATSGMSHMLEHLLFNGTEKMTQKQLYDETDLIGGYNNAHTSEYYTNFMMVTPAENIKEGMKIQAEMLFSSILPDDKFEKEKGIVLEEIAKTLANPQAQVERNVNSIIYKNHALSLPTLGTYETIKNMNRNDVYDFYKNYYVPNNMIINVIGNFNKEEMIKWLNEFYGKASPGNVNYPDLNNWATGFNQPKGNSDLQKTYHRFYKGKNSQLQIFFELPNNLSKEFYELCDISLSNNSDTIKSTLKKEFPDDFAEIKFSVVTSPIKNLIEVNFILNKEDNISEIANSISKILLTTNFSLSKDIIENEVIKSSTSFYKNTEKPHMFGIFNAYQLSKFGIESILNSYSGKGFYSAAENLKNLKLKNIYTMIVEHPFASDIVKTKKDISDVKLFKATKERPAIIVKQAENSDLLAIHYLLEYKSAYESLYGKHAAQIWHDAFGSRLKSNEVKKKSLPFGFTYTVNDNPYIPMDNIYLDPSFGYIRVEGLAKDVKGAIGFLNNEFKSFVPTKAEYETAKQKLSMISMMARGNKAKDLFDDKLNEALFVPDKYPDTNNVVTYENLLEFGKNYFTPANMILSVVSPSPADEINSYFNSFTSTNYENKFSGLGYTKEFNTITQPIKIDVKGEGEQSYLYFGFQKEIQENEKPALLALSLLLKDDIIFNIREKQGMAYRMSAGIDMNKNKAMFYVNMGTRPENVVKLIPQFPSLFYTDYADSITANKLKKAVNMYLGRMMFRRLSSINQGYYLGHSLYFYDDINYDNKFLAALKKVSLEEVKAVAEKYLDVKNPVEIYVR